MQDASPEPSRFFSLSLVPALAPGGPSPGAFFCRGAAMTDAPRPDDAALRAVLTRTKVIAVVGISPDPVRPSYYVARYLKLKGYRVIPVNPGHAGETLLGETVVASLRDIPPEVPVDMVDLFRRSEHIPPLWPRRWNTCLPCARSGCRSGCSRRRPAPWPRRGA